MRYTTKLQKQMSFVDLFKSELFETNSTNFDEKCLSLFRFQYENNQVYQDYVQALNLHTDEISSVKDIPFLPITLFKNYKITSLSKDIAEYFESSGTTGVIKSRLYYDDKEFYLKNSVQIFESNFGKLSDFSFFFLLPNYLERQNSSLVAMADRFYNLSDKSFGGFYLYDLEELKAKLQEALALKPGFVILWGVTFALLDFAEKNDIDTSSLIVFETGGMKGRGREPLRSEIHLQLRQKLLTNKIYSEYA